MRPAWFASSCIAALAALAACGAEPDTTVIPTTVDWMEWPAEVKVGAPIDVRLVGGQPCGILLELRTPASVDNSAVTFEPYFLAKKGIGPCPLPASSAPRVSIIAVGFDTTAVIGGLPADYDRVYEMRAAASSFIALPTAGLPVRTFGTIAVRLAQPDAGRTAAAGFAYEYKDGAGCVRLQPRSAYRSGGYLVENADSASVLDGMVRGYLYQGAAPVCGETRVFHLESVD